MDENIEEVMTENERLKEGGMELLCQSFRAGDLYRLENEILKYFKKNEKRILEIQDRYQEKGMGIDVVTATELALRQDVFSPEKDSNKGIYGFVGMLQYLMAVKVAQDKSPGGALNDQAVVMELKDISQTFRPNYIKYVGLVNLVLESKAAYFQKKFMEIMGPAA